MSVLEIIATVLLVSIAFALIIFIAAKVSERRNPPIGGFLQVDGVKLHYVERGRGEPVVLLHGNATMLQDFLTSGIVDTLASRYRVLLFDRPGFGYSDRPRDVKWTAARQARLIGKAITSLGVERPIVVGHSWGTLVAFALAQEQPQRVRSLLLISGFYFPEFRLDVVRASPPAIPVLGDILRYTLSPLLGALLMPITLRAMFGPPAVPRRFKQEFPLSMMLRPWQIRAAAQDAALMIPDATALRPGYREMKVPVVIMAGTKDRIVDIERQSARLQSEVPGSKLEVVPEVGHMVHHSVPDQVVTALDRAAMAPQQRNPGQELRS